MNYFWSFLFIAASVNAAYNPFFHPLAKPKKAPTLAPLVAPEARAMPLPPLLKPAFNVSEEKVVFDLAQLIYSGFLETAKGKYALIKVNANTIILKEGDPFYANNIKYFIRNITSNYITVDDAGRNQTIYFTTGGL